MVILNAFGTDKFERLRDCASAIGASIPFHHRCDYVEVWSDGVDNLNSMVAPLGSPLTPFLKHRTMAVFQRGCIQRDIKSYAIRPT